MRRCLILLFYNNALPKFVFNKLQQHSTMINIELFSKRTMLPVTITQKFRCFAFKFISGLYNTIMDFVLKTMIETMKFNLQIHLKFRLPVDLQIFILSS